MSPQLEHGLGLYYKARVLGGGNLKQVRDQIKTRFEADQSLAAEGRAELARIEEMGMGHDLQRRCFVSHIHREALTRLLPKQS